jgi:hypothetical protein
MKSLNTGGKKKTPAGDGAATGRNNCEVCGKPLSNYVSVKLGIGPVCRGKGAVQMSLPFENHAEYEVITVNAQFLYLEDTGHNQFKTVTNDAENVIDELRQKYGIEGRRIFYKDSLGQIDELLHRNGLFFGFRLGHKGYSPEAVAGREPLPEPAKKKRRLMDDNFGM